MRDAFAFAELEQVEAPEPSHVPVSYSGESLLILKVLHS